MPTTSQNQSTASDQMKSVKAAWDKAPAGTKKDTAHTHYLAAEAALKRHDEKACITELEKARKALK